MPPRQSWKSYTSKFKLTAVEFTLKNGNRAAGRHFGVSEKMVRDWRKSEEKLRAVRSTKKADRGLKARWPELEARLRTWVLEQRAEGRGLSTVQLRLKARTFMRRNCLSIRARTTLCQKLPEDFAENLEKFKAFVKKQMDESEISEDHIVNMDEIPLTFDIPMGRTVAQKGEKSVLLRTTGHEKSHFTVVLACCADGTKLPPMLVFKRKTLPNDSFPSGVIIQANEKGWMDESMMTVWLEKCFVKRPDGFFHVKKRLLVMDSMRAHITDATLKRVKAVNCTPTVIPGGMTKLLQPLDISVNRSFKAVLRHLWESWMTDGDHSFTATGRMRHATFGEVAKWVDEAWDTVSASTITAGFQKAGLVASAPAGDYDSSASSDSEDDNDVPATLPSELAELFNSASEDEAFDGF
ncbi:hypothetical protein MTO96_040572 [Rhipicephalus appendiculatus]